MSNIWLTSDLHFGHDRDFIWGARGYNSVEEMNKEQLRKFNEKVQPEDDVYICGDLMLGGDAGKSWVSQLNGKIHIILGNHDTNSRAEWYRELPQVVEVVYATMIKAAGRHWYLSHYPTMVINQGELKGQPINLAGHTHSKDKWENIQTGTYNIAVDAHNGYPVNIADIALDIKNYFKK